MKLLHLLLLTLLTAATSQNAIATPYQCTFESGDVVETQFACEPAMVRRFGNRLLELCPEVRQISIAPDCIMGLYTFAMVSCTGQFAKMTPEEIGSNGDRSSPRRCWLPWSGRDAKSCARGLCNIRPPRH